MNAQECLNMLRDIKDVSFATVDENNMPQVRIIDVMLIEDDVLYFCTSRGKEFYKQLISGGHVAIVGMNDNFQTVRLNGKTEKVLDNKKWIDKIFEQNPSMNSVYPGESRYILDAFCIRTAEIEFFDLSASPIFRQGFSIGGKSTNEKGFIISDDCIACGKCAELCPQNCIKSGDIYTIIQENCLHCGLCFENCPAESIIRR